MEPYQLENIKYIDELLPEIDATYIIHLEGNGRYAHIQDPFLKHHPTKEVFTMSANTPNPEIIIMY
jgi:hypothetical protein